MRPDQHGHGIDGAHQQHGDHRVAHDVLELELGQRQRRQDPERLHEVVPAVAQHHRHGGLRLRGAQRGGRVDHERALQHPVAAARGREEVDHEGAHEAPQRQRGGGGDVHEHVRDGLHQPRAVHDRHDAGVERELQDDPADGLHALVDLLHVLHRRAQQQHPEEQDEEVDHVQVEVAAFHEVHGHVRHAAQPDQQAQQAAVVQAVCQRLLVAQQPLGAGRGFRLGHGGRVQLHHFLALLGVHGGIEQRQRDQHGQAGQQDGRGEDRLRERDQAHGALEGMALGGDEHGDRRREAQAVHREARVGRRDDQRIVHALHLQCQLARHDAADHQAEAPVQVAAHAAHDGRDDDGLARRAHARGDAVEEAVHDGRGREHVAHHQDHGHLRREGQQAPEALAPVLHHGVDRAALHPEGQRHGEQREQDREDERIGQVAPHQFGEEGGDFRHGRTCLAVMG